MAEVTVKWEIPPPEIVERRNRGIRKAHRRLADDAARQMIATAPVRTGLLRSTIRVEDESRTVTWVKVGREGETPYLGWQEFGASRPGHEGYQPARPFVRPAADQYGGQLEPVMTQELRRELG